MKTTLFRNLTIAGLAVLVVALAACSGTPMKAYSGPALPVEQTAIVRSGPYTDLVSVDGVRVKGLSVAVRPGTHTIEMKPADNQEAYGYQAAYYFYSLVTGTVTVNTEAGRTYQAYVRIAPAPGSLEERSGGYGAEGQYIDTSDSGYAWTGYVRDETNPQNVVRTRRLPIVLYPRAYPGGIATGVGSSIHVR